MANETLKETHWTHFDNIQDLIKWNEQLKCATPNCNNYRFQRSKHCNKCRLNVWKFGSAHLRAIPKRAYSDHIKRVRKLLRFNHGHPVVMDFIERFNEVCEAAHNDVPVPFKLYFKAVYDQMQIFKSGKFKRGHAVYFRNALTLLEELAGFHLLLETDYGVIVKTDEQKYYAFAQIVLWGAIGKIRPRPTPKKFNAFGKEIESMFYIHMVKIARGVLKSERKDERRLELLKNAEFN